MKINKAFTPISIVLETQEEVKFLLSALYSKLDSQDPYGLGYGRWGYKDKNPEILFTENLVTELKK